MAKDNPFRFSTKLNDDESDLLYYGYRYYNPSAGRWLMGDPIEEQGGKNLYAFVDNRHIGRVDLLGHVSLDFKTTAPPAGLMNGRYKPWDIKWLVPKDSPEGFVIQHIDYVVQATDCNNNTLTQPQIWKLFESRPDDPLYRGILGFTSGKPGNIIMEETWIGGKLQIIFLTLIRQGIS